MKINDLNQDERVTNKKRHIEQEDTEINNPRLGDLQSQIEVLVVEKKNDELRIDELESINEVCLFCVQLFCVHLHEADF